MKVLHLSDVHIGVENYGRPSTESDVDELPASFAPGIDRSEYVGVSTRLLDFLVRLDSVVEYAISNNIDLILFAGDAYKNRDPSQTHQREFARRVERLNASGIPIFFSVGNHDLPHVTNRATALEIFPTLSVANVTVGSELKTYHVNTRLGAVQVVSLPWIRISQLLAREETRNLTLEGVTRLVEEKLSYMLQQEIDGLDPNLPSFLCGHVTVTGATVASERTMMLGTDHVLTLGTVANRKFDYVALGHIHKHQVLTQNPLVVYPGSLERIDFTEENDDKGFCVVELDPTTPQGDRVQSFRFVPVDARRFLTIDVTVHDGQDPTEATISAIEKAGIESITGAVVRLRISMNVIDEPGFHEATIRSALKMAHHIAGIDRNIKRERRTRIGTDGVEGLSPIDALKRYTELKNVPQEREGTLIQYAQRLLTEEGQDS